MPKLNVLQAFSVLAGLLGEAELLGSEIKAGQTVQSPGVSETIDGVEGRLGLYFTPNAAASPIADAASTTEGSSASAG